MDLKPNLLGKFINKSVNIDSYENYKNIIETDVKIEEVKIDNIYLLMG